MIDLKYIDFSRIMIENYLRLRIDEIDLIILMLLYEFEVSGNNIMSIQDLSRRMSVNSDDIANKVDLLVSRNFIKLSSEDELRYSLSPTFEQIHNLFREDNLKRENQNDVPRIITLIEDEFKRILSTKELDLIRQWNYSFEQVKDALLETIKQDKLRIEYLNKVLENKYGGC